MTYQPLLRSNSTPPTRSCVDERWVADTALHCSRSLADCSLIVFLPSLKKASMIDVPSTGRGGGLGKLAGSRSVDHGLLLCVFDSKSTEYQKSDGQGEVPVEGSAVEGQSAAGTREENERCRGRRPMPSVGFSTKATNTPDGQYLGFQFN